MARQRSASVSNCAILMLVFMYFDAVFTKRRFTDTHATKTKSVPFDDFFDAYDDFQSRAIRFPAYDKTTCKSEACMKTSEKILAAINEQFDPCDDFYGYACGNWIASNPVPDRRTEISKFSILADKMERIKLDILSSRGAAFSSESKAKSYYKQCTDTGTIEKLRGNPLLQVLDRTIGGWPVLQAKWNAKHFDLFESLLLLKGEYGIEPLMQLSVEQDALSLADNVIFLVEPNVFVSKDIMISDAKMSYIDSFRKLLGKIGSLLHHDSKSSRPLSEVFRELEEVVEFSNELSMMKSTSLEMRDITRLTNKVTFNTTHQKLDFKSKFLRRLVDYTRGIFAFVGLEDKISGDTSFILTCEKFLQRLDDKLDILEKQPNGKRVLANYIGFQVVSLHAKRLSKPFRDAFDEHTQRTTGRKTRENKSVNQSCVAEVVEEMPLATSAAYVRDHMDPLIKKKATEMVKDLKEAMRHLLESATWMDDLTAKAAFRKLSSMENLVAYSELLSKNVSAIDEEYHDIKIEKNYFSTHRGIDKREVAKNLKRLIKKNVRNDAIADQTDIMAVNAFYDIIQNRIVVLASLLRSPFYAPTNPQYANYGGIGFAIGHEITHGFDDRGASFDEEGMYNPWWTKKTLQTFDFKKRGLVEQYNGYSTSAGSVNGELTIGENIADNGGLKAAYKAYRLFRERSPNREQLLPGLEQFTVGQLFFISAAQVWCSAERPESAKLHMLSSVHSPDQFRVNGPVSNMPEFGKAFGCAAGTKMNPVAKQGVW